MSQGIGFSRFVEVAPGQKFSNDQLPTIFPLIEERTGIRSRSIAGCKDTIETMGIEAIKNLFDMLNITAHDCGGLVLSSSTGNEARLHQVSHVAKKIASQLGIPGKALGLNYACSGFPASVQKAMELSEETDRHILVVTSEIMSRLVDWNEEATAVLFGDRATATSIIAGGQEIIEANAWEIDDPNDLIHFEKRAEAMNIEGTNEGRICISMNGRALYKMAPREMTKIIINCMNRWSLDLDEVGAIVPHQANGRFMKKIREILQKENDERWENKWVVDDIEQMANVTSSSIPAALAFNQGTFQNGEIIICPAIGAGPDYDRSKLTEGIVAYRVSK